MAGSQLTQPQVVCPHCWHRFYPDEAKYISQHPALFGDSILGDNEQQRFSLHEVQSTRGGDVVDPMGMKMTERACSRCHLQVPPDLLRQRPCFISLVGAPRSGKTYFLTAMIHEMRSLMTKFGFSLYDADSHEVKAFIEYERQLFNTLNPNHLTYLEKTEETGKLYNRVRLADVDVQLPKPFIFSLRPTAANIAHAGESDRLHQSFVIYDNAGEAFEYLKEKDATNLATRHLGEADAIFLAYDPLQEPDARERLANISDDPQLHLYAVNYRQEEILTETINRIRRHRGLSSTEMIDCCLCICVQKYDTWLPMFRDVRDENGIILHQRFAEGQDLPDPVCVDRKYGLAGIDVEQINRVSLAVRQILQTLNPQIVALAESSFSTVRYFPVSALGTSPSPRNDGQRLPMSGDISMLKVRPDQVRPRRVTSPLLWLLNRQRMIMRVKRPNSRDSNKYPHATIVDANARMMRIRTPSTDELLHLDLEYGESVIEEPGSGQPIWIPSPPRTSVPIIPDTRQNLAEKPAGQDDGQKKPKSLGLTINKQSKRKGWFRK